MWQNLRRKIASTNRRFKQEMAIKYGHAEVSSDETFAYASKHFLEIEEALQHFTSNLETYCRTLETLAATQVAIAADLASFTEKDTPEKACLDEYHQSMLELENKYTPSVIGMLQDTVITPLRFHLNDLPSVKEAIEKRSRKKTDMDYYNQKLSTQQEKRKLDKTGETEEKLRQATEVYSQITASLLEWFSEVSDMAERFATSSFDLVHLQAQWFNRCAQVFSKVEPSVEALQLEESSIVNWRDATSHAPYKQFADKNRNEDHSLDSHSQNASKKYAHRPLPSIPSKNASKEKTQPHSLYSNRNPLGSAFAPSFVVTHHNPPVHFNDKPFEILHNTIMPSLQLKPYITNSATIHPSAFSYITNTNSDDRDSDDDGDDFIERRLSKVNFRVSDPSNEDLSPLPGIPDESPPDFPLSPPCSPSPFEMDEVDFEEESRMSSNSDDDDDIPPPPPRSPELTFLSPLTSILDTSPMIAAPPAPTTPISPAPTRYRRALRQVKVIHAFTKTSQTELTLKEGDIINIKNEHNSGWWFGTNLSGESGFFPSNHVQEVVKPVLGIASILSPSPTPILLQPSFSSHSHHEPDNTIRTPTALVTPSTTPSMRTFPSLRTMSPRSTTYTTLDPPFLENNMEFDDDDDSSVSLPVLTPATSSHTSVTLTNNPLNPSQTPNPAGLPVLSLASLQKPRGSGTQINTTRSPAITSPAVNIPTSTTPTYLSPTYAQPKPKTGPPPPLPSRKPV